MNIKKYPLFKLNRKVLKKCSSCTGRGCYFDFNAKEDRDCPTCSGSGTVQINLVLCTSCKEVVEENYLYSLKDSEGQTVKKICYGCLSLMKRDMREVI